MSSKPSNGKKIIILFELNGMKFTMEKTKKSKWSREAENAQNSQKVGNGRKSSKVGSTMDPQIKALENIWKKRSIFFDLEY